MEFSVAAKFGNKNAGQRHNMRCQSVVDALHALELTVRFLSTNFQGRWAKAKPKVGKQKGKTGFSI